MTLARGSLLQPHETYLAVKAGRVLRGWSQAQMAELMAEATGSDEWTENRITAIENGRKIISDTDLRVFAEVQGYSSEFYWYGPAPHRKLRDLNADNALYRGSYEPYEDLHPVNAGVKDGGWFARDDEMHLPNPSWWEGLQAETLPIKIAS